MSVYICIYIYKVLGFRVCVYIYMIYMYMRYSLNSVKKGSMWDKKGSIIALVKGDIRSLDYSSYTYTNMYIYICIYVRGFPKIRGILG